MELKSDEIAAKCDQLFRDARIAFERGDMPAHEAIRVEFKGWAALHERLKAGSTIQ